MARERTVGATGVGVPGTAGSWEPGSVLPATAGRGKWGSYHLAERMGPCPGNGGSREPGSVSPGARVPATGKGGLVRVVGAAGSGEAGSVPPGTADGSVRLGGTAVSSGAAGRGKPRVRVPGPAAQGTGRSVRSAVGGLGEIGLGAPGQRRLRGTKPGAPRERRARCRSVRPGIRDNGAGAGSVRPGTRGRVRPGGRRGPGWAPRRRRSLRRGRGRSRGAERRRYRDGCGAPRAALSLLRAGGRPAAAPAAGNGTGARRVRGESRGPGGASCAWGSTGRAGRPGTPAAALREPRRG